MPKITDSSVNSKLQEACNTFVPTTINFTDLSQIKEFPDIGRQFSNDTQLFSSLTSFFFNKEAGEKIAKYYDLFVSKSNITVADFNSLRFSLHLAVNLLEDSLPVVSPEIIMNLLCNIEQSADMCVQGINSDLDLIISTLQAVREEGPDSSRTLVAKSLVDNLAGKFIFEMHQEGNLVYLLTEEKHVKNALTDNVSDIFKLPKSKDKLASGRQIVSDEVHTKFKFLCKLLIPRYVIIDEMAQKFDSIFKDIFPHHYKDARSIINIPSEDLTSDFIDKIESKLLAPFKHLKQGNTDETTNLRDFIEINSDGTCSIPYFYENIRVLLIKTIDDTIQQRVLEVIKNKEGKTLCICNINDAFFWVCDKSDTIKESPKKGDICVFDNKNHIPLQLSHLTSLNFEGPTEKNYVYTLLIQALNQTDKVEDIKAFFLDGNGMDVLDKCPLAIKLKLSELLKNKTDENPVFKNELCKLFNEYLKSNVNIVVTEPVTLFEMYLYKKYENNNGDIADITSDLNASQIKNFSKMSIVKLFNNDDYRRLFDQVFHCKNKKIMESILSTDVCNELINQLDSEDDAPLIRAIKFNAPELIEPLLTKGDDADAWNQRAKEALSFAVEADHVDCVKALLVGKVPVDSQDNNGITELMYAAENGYDGCVNALLEGGASVNIKSNNGDAALMLASEKGQVDCVKALLKEDNVLIDSKDNFGQTALMLAAENGCTDCVNALLEGGASVNSKDSGGDTALIVAAESDRIGCVKALLEKDQCLVNSKNEAGFTALMHAAENGNDGCVNALLEKGKASVDITNNEGATALMLAVENGHIDCVDVLLEAGASVNSKDSDDDTALIVAAENDYIDCVKALLKKDQSSINSKNKEGFTALMYAAKNGHIDCINALLEGGASVNIKNESGETAEMLADKNDHDDCVKLLQKKKARF